MLMDVAALSAARLHNTGAWDYVRVAAMLQGILGDLPGWPLVPSLSKMQLQQQQQQQQLQQQQQPPNQQQMVAAAAAAAMDGCDKCEKCNQLFFSPLNYRRHARVHRRTLGADKEDLIKEKARLMAFFGQLSAEEAAELLSLKDFNIEDLNGDAAMKELASLVDSRRGITSGGGGAGAPSIPPSMQKAGTLLLGMAMGKPLSLECREELFDVLHEATEGTFLRGGTGVAVLRFVYQGCGKRAALEDRNLIAHLAFLVEHKLVQAWMADKEAEALRCQQALVEEEEAAQQKRVKLQERKRAKKIRQKELKERKGSGNISEYIDGDMLPEGSAVVGREGGVDEDMGLDSPHGTEVEEAQAGVGGSGMKSTTEQGLLAEDDRNEKKYSRGKGVGDGGRAGAGERFGGGDGTKEEACQAASLRSEGEVLGYLNLGMGDSLGAGRVVGRSTGKEKGGAEDKGLNTTGNGIRKENSHGEDVDEFLECDVNGATDGGGEKVGHRTVLDEGGSTLPVRGGVYSHSEGSGSSSRPSSSGGVSHHHHHQHHPSREGFRPRHKTGSSYGSGSSWVGDTEGEGIAVDSAGGSSINDVIGWEGSKGGSTAVMSDERIGRGADKVGSGKGRGVSLDEYTENRGVGTDKGGVGRGGRARVERGGAGASDGGLDAQSASSRGFSVGPDSDFPPLPKSQISSRGRGGGLARGDTSAAFGRAGSGQKNRGGGMADVNKYAGANDYGDGNRVEKEDRLAVDDVPADEMEMQPRNVEWTAEKGRDGEKGDDVKGGRPRRGHNGGDFETGRERRAGSSSGDGAGAGSIPAFVSGVIVVGQIPVVLTSGWEARRSLGNVGPKASEVHEQAGGGYRGGGTEKEGGGKKAVWMARGGGPENVVAWVDSEGSNPGFGDGTHATGVEGEAGALLADPTSGGVRKEVGGIVGRSVPGLVIGDIVTPVKLETVAAKDVLPDDGGGGHGGGVLYKQLPPLCGSVHPVIAGVGDGQGGSNVCLAVQSDVVPMGVCLTPDNQPLPSAYHHPWGVGVQTQMGVRGGVAITAPGLYTPATHCVPHNPLHVPIGVTITGGIPDRGMRGVGTGAGFGSVGILHMPSGPDGGGAMMGQMGVLEGSRKHDMPSCDPSLLMPHGLHRGKGDNSSQCWGMTTTLPRSMAGQGGQVQVQAHNQSCYPGQQLLQQVSRHGYTEEGSPMRRSMGVNVNVTMQQGGSLGGMAEPGPSVWQFDGEPRGGRMTHGSGGMLDGKRRWDARGGQDSRLQRQGTWGIAHGKTFPTKVWRAVGVVNSQNLVEGSTRGDTTDSKEGNAVGVQEIDERVLGGADSLVSEAHDKSGSSGSGSEASLVESKPEDLEGGTFGMNHAYVGDDDDGAGSGFSHGHSGDMSKSVLDADPSQCTLVESELEHATSQEAGGQAGGGEDAHPAVDGGITDTSFTVAGCEEDDGKDEPLGGGSGEPFEEQKRVLEAVPMQDRETEDVQSGSSKETRWERRWRPSGHGADCHSARFLSQRWEAAMEDSEACVYNGDASDGDEPVSSSRLENSTWEDDGDAREGERNEHLDSAVDAYGHSGGSAGREDATAAGGVEMQRGGSYWGGGGVRSRGGYGNYDGSRYMSRGGGRGRGGYREERSDNYSHYDGGDMEGRNGGYYGDRTDRYYGTQGYDSERYGGKGGRSLPSERRMLGGGGGPGNGMSNYSGPGRRMGGSGPAERGGSGRWRGSEAAPYEQKVYARKSTYI